MNKLSDYADYVEEKIENILLTNKTYIGVDNLLPNRNGIKTSNYKPDEGSSIKFKKNDILIGNIRPYFKKIWLASFNGGCSSDVLCIRPKKQEYSRYLYSVLSQDLFFDYDMAGSKGSKMPRGDKRHIMNFPIEIIKNYETIGNILFNIDAQIKRNNDMVQKLQVLSQGIFNKLFSDETNNISLLDFPYIQIIKPGISKFEGTKHYIATAEVDNEKVNYNAPLIDFDTRENRANMQPVKNSVWFAKMKNSLKHIYISDTDSMMCSNYIFSTGFTGIKCDDFAFEYLVNFINMPYFENKKNILSHGATMEGVNNEDLKSIQIPLPSKDKLIIFHNKVKEIHYQTTKLNEQTFKLNVLKEKLLPLLINGQLI